MSIAPYPSHYTAQPADLTLSALAALPTEPDTAPYFTGIDSAALMTVTPFMRSLLDDPDAATARSTLGVTEGGGGTPGGLTTQVQYNNASAFAGSAGMTLNATTVLTLVGNRATFGGHSSTGVLDVQGNIVSENNNQYYNLRLWPVAPASAVQVHGLRIEPATGAAIGTSQHIGVSVLNPPTSSGNVQGIQLNVAAGTNRWNIYSAGTAVNYFASGAHFGAGIAIAGPPVAGYNLYCHTNDWSYINGRLGVITDNPGYGLHVADNAKIEGDFYVGTTCFHADPATGRVGIGVASPAYPLDVTGNVRVSNGALGLGRTPSCRIAILYDRPNMAGIVIQPNADTGAGSAIWFTNAADSIIGSVSTNTNTTFYNTTSDSRLKEQISPLAGATAVVEALRPVQFLWKADGSQGHGFLANEVQALVPEAVTGAPDAVDAEGNILPQGMDNAKLVPWLTAALQDVLARLAVLEAHA